MSNILSAKFPNIYKAVSEARSPREAFGALRSACVVMDELVRLVASQTQSYQKGTSESVIMLGLLESLSEQAMELRNRFNISRMVVACNDPYRVSAIIDSIATQLEGEGQQPRGGFTPPSAPAEPIGAAYVCDSEDAEPNETEKPFLGCPRQRIMGYCEACNEIHGEENLKTEELVN